MSKLYHKGRVILFKCDRKRCGDRCHDECEWTTDIENAETEGEYDVKPAPEDQSELYYIAVPVKRSGEKNQDESKS